MFTSPFPVHNVPEINAATDQQIEEAAEHCRAQWRLARDLPIANILRVAESAGVPVAKFTDIGEKVDSFSRAGSPCVIVLTDKAASRCRYDVAHELGHLVLHRGKTTGTKETEAQANRFAAALLLPAHRFLGEFPRHLSGFWDSMFRLKTRWRVSLGAMIRRASEYNVIGPTHYTRLYKELSVRGWLRHEPCEFDAEQPEILPFALETVKQAQGLSLDNVRTALAWKPDTFEQLTGIAIHREEPPRRAKIIQLRSS
jgi:Zn-dependent peptidase ImmA (M78 family)